LSEIVAPDSRDKGHRPLTRFGCVGNSRDRAKEVRANLLAAVYSIVNEPFNHCRGLVISRFANIGLQTLLRGGQALLPAFSARHSLICFCCSAYSTVEAQDRNRCPPSGLRPDRKMFCCEPILNLMVLEALAH